MANQNDIIALPHKSLRKKSKRVSVVGAKAKKLISDMIEAGLDWEAHHPHEVCVGLAAVQVNELKKIVIIRTEDTKKKEFDVLINPRLVKTYGELELDFEGCLSVSGIYGIVPRYPKVKVQAIDENGKQFRVTANGFMARLLQHEIDHTDGKVFIDHIFGERNAFHKITSEGKIEKLDYKEVENSDLFR